MPQRVRAGIGVIAVALTMSLIPALSASASMDKGTKGSNPDSALCKAYHSNAGRDTKDAAAAAKGQKALESRNWTVARTNYLSAFGGQAKEDQVLLSALGGAPSNVKAAVTVIRDYVTAFRGALEKSNSISQFTKAGAPLVKDRKVPTAENTLARYFIAQCGSPTA